MKKIFLLASLFFPLTGAYAQGIGHPDPWTLRECVDYAIDHNISLKQNALNVEQREIELNTAKNRILPGVSASGGQNFSFGRGLTADNTYSNSNTTNTSLSLGASIPIFSGLDIKHDIAMSKLNLEASLIDLERAKDDIRIAVAKAFVEVLYNKEIIVVAKYQVQRDSIQLARLQDMQANGKVSAAEVSAQRSALEKSLLSQVQAEGNLKMALLSLSQLLELGNPEGFDVIAPVCGSFENRLIPDPEAIYAEAVEIKPSIRSEEIKLDYSATGIDRAKGGYLPTLSLSGGLGTNYYTSSNVISKSFGEQFRNNFSQYIGLSLNIPVFSRFTTRNNIKSAKLSYANQKFQLESIKKNLYKEIQQAYYSALISRQKYTSSSTAVQSAHESFDLTEAKYSGGKANITEYNDSKSRLMEAEANQAQAKYEMIFNTALLDFYRGRELVL